MGSNLGVIRTFPVESMTLPSGVELEFDIGELVPPFEILLPAQLPAQRTPQVDRYGCSGHRSTSAKRASYLRRTSGAVVRSRVPGGLSLLYDHSLCIPRGDGPHYGHMVALPPCHTFRREGRAVLELLSTHSPLVKVRNLHVLSYLRAGFERGMDQRRKRTTDLFRAGISSQTSQGPKNSTPLPTRP